MGDGSVDWETPPCHPDSPWWRPHRSFFPSLNYARVYFIELQASPIWKLRWNLWFDRSFGGLPDHNAAPWCTKRHLIPSFFIYLKESSKKLVLDWNRVWSSSLIRWAISLWLTSLAANVSIEIWIFWWISNRRRGNLFGLMSPSLMLLHWRSRILTNLL